MFSLSQFQDSTVEEFLAVLDKIERQDESVSNMKLARFSTTVAKVNEWAQASRQQLLDPNLDISRSGLAHFRPLYQLLHQHLSPRGLLPYVDIDFSIVRGLAYYTGLVFEVFDQKKSLRAVAGGGRYDNLMSAMSDGKVTLPAIGFGMGDVVLGELIDATPVAAEKMRAWIAQRHAADVYVVIANETRRVDALGLVQQLRSSGFRVDYALSPAKVGKQFQAAEQAGARFALVIGDEWPQLKLKTLATREECLVSVDELSARLAPISH